MAREYVEKNTAEMVRCLKELVAIPGIFEDAPSKGAPRGTTDKFLDPPRRMSFSQFAAVSGHTASGASV